MARKQKKAESDNLRRADLRGSRVRQFGTGRRVVKRRLLQGGDGSGWLLRAGRQSGTVLPEE
jgi:hypothetical protein